MNRKFALTATLAAGMAATGMALAPMAADAALLELTDGTELKTPSNNDVLGSGTTLLDNAKLSTTENNVKLTFYFVDSESGFNNTLNVGGPDGIKYTEADEHPASWLEPLAIGSVTQDAAGPVDMFFTSSGFSGQLEPGQVDTSKSIAFAYLADTSGAISTTPTDVVLFALDDSGAGPDDDYDDYVGYVVAEKENTNRAVPVAPAPIPAALPLFVTAMVGLGLLGRRRKAAA